MLGAILLAATVAAVLLSVRLGSVPLTTAEVLGALGGDGDPVVRDIVLQLRLPRVLLGVLVGGGLAIAGATFQALLRNPLAEPYILGISGGASVGAVLVLAFGWVAAGSWALPLAAFVGALVAIVLVFRVRHGHRPAMDVRVLLLAGVVVGRLLLRVHRAHPFRIPGAVPCRARSSGSWGAWRGPPGGACLSPPRIRPPRRCCCSGLARPLNLLSIGEETAHYLGADVEGVKRISLVVASLITASGVAVAGVIGFVGLVVPHAVRLLVGSDHRALLPLSFLAGAAFLTLADLVARLAMAPTEIPIGVITAFVGVPFFCSCSDGA